ncbi:MAG: response regulator [Planctomycetes bacterium]|nr:response regulator [Planctomycetota bacterium]
MNLFGPILAAVAATVVSSASAQQFHVQRYDELDGMPSAQVYSLCQAEDGVVWFATRIGVVGYDGGNWLVRAGHGNDTWSCVAPAKGGGCWALSAQAPLRVAFCDSERWHEMPPALLDIEPSPTALAVTSRGELLVGTRFCGLLCYRDGGWRRLSTEHGVVGMAVYAIAEHGGDVYVGSSRGLFRFPGDDFDRPPELVGNLPGGAVYGLATDGDAMWVAMDQWIGQLRQPDQPARIVYVGGSFAAGNAQVAIASDREGGAWFGGVVGVYRLRANGELRVLGKEHGLIEGTATDLMLDHEGNTWISGWRGVSKVVGNDIDNFTSQHGLYDDEVSAICVWGRRRIVLGHDGGLTIVENGTPRTLAFGGRQPAARVLDLARGSGDSVWVAGSWRGLASLSPEGLLTWFDPPAEDQVHAVLTVGDTVCVGTGSGLWNFADGVWSRPSPLPEPLKWAVRRLHPDGKGGLWGATSTHGIWHRSADGTVQAWAAANVIENSTFCVLPMADGRVLVGSRAGVLETTATALRPAARYELDCPVFAFAVDPHDGALWAGTTQGVVRLGADGGRRWLGIRDGLIGTEINRDAMGFEDGRLVLGTNRGLSMVRFDRPGQVRPPPRLTFTSVQARVREEDPWMAVFAFRSDSFLDERRVTFRYRLDGLQEHWSEPQELPERVVRFASLPPGDYQLHLQATTPDGRSSEVVVSAPVSVPAPWYLRPWFVVAATGLFGLVVFGTVALLAQRRYGRRLELEVQERTRALAASEGAAHADRERLAVTLTNIADGVAAADADGRVFVWNPAAERSTGILAADANGCTIEALLGITEPLPASGSATFDFARDGAVLHFEASIAPLGRGCGRVVAFRDISHRLAAERSLAHRQRLESLGLLAGGIAHDFNNYLTVVLGAVTTIDREPGLGADSHEQARLACETIGRAEALTRQLLTFSTGGSPVRAAVDLGKLLHDAVAIALSGSPVRARVLVEPGLPKASIDAGQIAQVLHNLLLNARQAMPDGGTVVLRARRLAEVRPGLQAGPWLVVDVVDEGIGMTAAVRQRIFEPFFSSRGGTGLGLAVVYSIVTRHGGTISVQSEPGRGSSFELVLPAVTPATIVASPPVIAAVPAAPRRRLRVLVMDDEPAIRRVEAHMLGRLGHECVAVEEGGLALTEYAAALAAGRPFDLVLLDLTVAGGMGGSETARRLLREHPAAKLIAVSGYSTDAVLGRSASGGFCAALAKPFTLDELARVLDEVVCAVRAG